MSTKIEPDLRTTLTPRGLGGLSGLLAGYPSRPEVPGTRILATRHATALETSPEPVQMDPPLLPSFLKARRMVSFPAQ